MTFSVKKKSKFPGLYDPTFLINIPPPHHTHINICYSICSPGRKSMDLRISETSVQVNSRHYMTFLGLKCLSLHFFFVKEREICSEHRWASRFYSIQSLPNTAGLLLFNINQEKSLYSKPSQDSTSDSSHSNSISSGPILKFFTMPYNEYTDPKTCALFSFTVWPCLQEVHSVTPLLSPLASCCSWHTGHPSTSGPLHNPSHLSGGFLSNLFRPFLTIHFLRKASAGYQSYRRCRRRNTILSHIVKESGNSFAFLSYFLHPITFACYSSLIPQISI